VNNLSIVLFAAVDEKMQTHSHWQILCLRKMMQTHQLHPGGKNNTA